MNAITRKKTLGIILSLGEGMETLEKFGQASRFTDYYLTRYAAHFDTIYFFSWRKDAAFINSGTTLNFPKNFRIIPNRYGLNPYIYLFLMPFLERKYLARCEMLRLMQFTPIISAVISKLLYKNTIVATYGYGYASLLSIDGKNIKSILIRLQDKLLLRFVDQFIVTFYRFTHYLMENGIPENRIFLTRNGVDTNQFKPPEHPRTFDPIHIKILFVGRFEPQKNLENLTRALVHSRHREKLIITFIGRGSQKKLLETLANNLRIKIRFIDPLPHAELVSHYQQTDVFTLVSHDEGHVKVLVEAMACGIPSVVSRYPGHEYLAKDGFNALTCDMDYISIRDTLDRLIEDQILQKTLSNNARKFTVENCDINKLLDKELDLLQTL